MNLGGEPFDVEEEDGRSIVKKELGVTGTIKAEARRPKQKVLFCCNLSEQGLYHLRCRCCSQLNKSAPSAL